MYACVYKSVFMCDLCTDGTFEIFSKLLFKKSFLSMSMSESLLPICSTLYNTIGMICCGGYPWTIIFMQLDRSISIFKQC